MTQKSGQIRSFYQELQTFEFCNIKVLQVLLLFIKIKDCVQLDLETITSETNKHLKEQKVKTMDKSTFLRTRVRGEVTAMLVYQNDTPKMATAYQTIRNSQFLID